MITCPILNAKYNKNKYKIKVQDNWLHALVRQSNCVKGKIASPPHRHWLCRTYSDACSSIYAKIYVQK